ncbi:hypothetical protein Cs7R123_44650 [Catellatospora sp. TT07R-123]|uniref:Pycsar system effector family protein n=1 Tax=Catellatospora sp. TT07R-123 TaxID=2733863 RepID=UPI001B226E43|nr:Pycsar system effector family protein [Catellatospora sp. TT07R-123]GHJ47123.1 hypothetical protein Cs7R123_44650 [Catellatospora sp. TT07R-123]
MDESVRDLAWRLHAVQEASVARVDVKASIMLALEGLLLVAAATGQQWVRNAERGAWAQSLGLVGVAVLTVAMLLAGAAVLPLVGSARRARAERADNAIYFGHVRHWAEADLAARLRDLDENGQVAMLTRQIVVVSRLSWHKHRLLQGSVILTLSSLVMLVIGFVAV